MRYPVMNLVRMGGLLEDYQKENDAFKEKLSKLNKDAEDKWYREHPTPPYSGPLFPSSAPFTPPPRELNRDTREFPYRPPPPGGFGPGAPPAPGVSVTGGIPMGPPTAPELPPLPPETPYQCNPGYSWIPGTGCVKNTPSNPDRPPMGPSIPTNPGPRPGGFGPSSPPLPGTSVATGIATEPGTLPPRPFEVPARAEEPCDPGFTRSPVPPYKCLKDVASEPNRPPIAMCPPGQFWDGKQCRGSIGPMPGGVPSGGGPQGAASGIQMPGAGGGYTSFAGAAFLGAVRLVAIPSPFGAPPLTNAFRNPGTMNVFASGLPLHALPLTRAHQTAPLLGAMGSVIRPASPPGGAGQGMVHPELGIAYYPQVAPAAAAAPAPLDLGVSPWTVLGILTVIAAAGYVAFK